MKSGSLKADRLVALFLLGFVLFNYPFLAVFNQARRVLGVPLLYLYLFAAWGVVIALAAAITAGGDDS
ncbi:MAG TPA: hypothetical protein VLT47_08620 [Anaeromyxobacteraceae bacterium]|nr:hypothetical protein [Anaeromyxobacteraceae bacterium]